MSSGPRLTRVPQLVLKGKTDHDIDESSNNFDSIIETAFYVPTGQIDFAGERRKSKKPFPIIYFCDVKKDDHLPQKSENRCPLQMDYQKVS
ncbi:hypothetical protein TNCV_2514371 [Trichonephila clavipes]|nr:hypothetical protein TNCV_2514371 [Trichonephila clavipes]